MRHPARAELRRSKYRLLGLVGQGQFGQVFCALHRPTGQLVALKNLEQDRFPTHKFLRELRFLLSLRHPNIVSCRALEHTSTGRYLVMDYCEGGTLRGLMPEDYRLSLPYAVSLIEDLLAGLEHAHSRGIVHCDIKPENILVQLQPQGWTARISDFGIARLSQEMKAQEGATGSPAYMAPERFYGQYSAASDLYSVGILLFELIAGYRPFSGTPAELMSAHLNRPLQMPESLSAIWQPIVAKALQKLPGRRFRSAAAMLEAVRLARAAELPQVEEIQAKALPLFFTVEAPAKCQFAPVELKQLAQAASRLAGDLADYYLWQASASQLSCWVKRSASQLDWLPQSAISEPAQQLLIRPQGCFVVMQRSLGLLSQPDRTLQHIFSWEANQAVAIAPQGDWIARLDLTQPSRQLRFQQLPNARSGLIAPDSVAVTGDAWLEMLALDNRHLALFWQASQSAGVTVDLLTRRGDQLGSFSLPLNLRQISLTPTPYRLLATDDRPGTVLLLDLKPYRIKRLWVEISPQFLVAAQWGYILAEAGGTVVFLDQIGQQIGQLTCPGQITALTLWQKQQQLWIATWSASQGILYSLALCDLGLDLVF